MAILKATKNNIIAAAQIVKNGGLVVYPTETVYGLGCNPLNIEAVNRIIAVKGNRNKPLPVLAATLKDAETVAFISSNAKKLATKFWPGPLTMVFPKKAALPDVVTFGLDSVGLRIPDNNVALQLIRLSGGLLVGSSANKSGELPAQSVEELSAELKETVDVVLDGGPAVQGNPSTVADLTSGKPKLLREGPISLNVILDALAFGDK
ncbi:MAG: L-threonylcarbamoyladenylate synthase [Candidatus Bathyarchaeota archaeon]|nr:L-threonylcarbamoyladenylate synthase [Candidatus Bathyarchaeum sp.]